ncbi:hypothetical protein DERP_008358 [Dermatophagoides pteronyssinus]|uniref:Uncharacterized protein n=1 Tax=Dermatophagoides pteronyssinus TaxID=6956 RepID=A0ABQ8IV32_DERPT|nr:hypothetical protein DERP_008358 [Dermatophagoides pteronyssinus]
MIIILVNMLELDNDYNCIHSDNATNEANTQTKTLPIQNTTNKSRYGLEAMMIDDYRENFLFPKKLPSQETSFHEYFISLLFRVIGSSLNLNVIWPSSSSVRFR